jgi:glycosyltransferase involved in cell wall biosynthesis
LVARGHTVTVVCGAHAQAGLELPFDPAQGWRRGLVDGIDVISLPLPYANRDGVARRTWTFLRFAARSVRLALTLEADLVFATSTPLTAALPGLAAQAARGLPFVFEVRDLWPELPRALGLRDPLLLGGMEVLETAAYRAADAVIGLSPGIVRGIRRKSSPRQRVVMIPNGSDLEVFHPHLRRAGALPGFGPDDFLAGFTGAHGPANGLDALLDVARELRRRGDRRVKLVFIGDGKEKERLAAQAAAEGLDLCRFFPPIPKTELGAVTASLDCGLMVLRDVPAFYDGTSPNKFFDYAAAGIPASWSRRPIRSRSPTPCKRSPPTPPAGPAKVRRPGGSPRPASPAPTSPPTSSPPSKPLLADWRPTYADPPRSPPVGPPPHRRARPRARQARTRARRRADAPFRRSLVPGQHRPGHLDRGP